ncbi:MAG: pilin [Patescibacteria group bacterium]
MRLYTIVRFLPAGLALMALIAVPHIGHAAGLGGVFDPIIPKDGSCTCPGSAPSWGCVLQVLQNVINVAIGVGIIICVLWLAWAGALFMMSGANPGLREQGKTRIANGVIGLLVILSAWLVVDFVMKTLYDPNTAFSGKNFGPWNSILASKGNDFCIVAHDPVSLAYGTVDILKGVTAGTATGPGGFLNGSGSCVIPTSGPCSVANLTPYFGSQQLATQASQVCFGESAGIINPKTTTDYMYNDPQKRPFSVGLFAINLTQNDLPGLPCSSKAFNGKNYTATVKDETLYAKCVAAAKTESINIQKAVSLYNSRIGKPGGPWKPWSAAKNCGLAYTYKDTLAFTTGLGDFNLRITLPRL